MKIKPQGAVFPFVYYPVKRPNETPPRWLANYA